MTPLTRYWHLSFLSVMTLRKLKTMMPSLKPPVTSMMRSNVVYQITCPRCKACYVGATTRHLRCRFSEHKSRKGCSVKQHINKCNVSLCEKDVTILGYNNREDHLFTLEAILQFEIRPKINGKEEFKTKTLSIIFWKMLHISCVWMLYSCRLV